MVDERNEPAPLPGADPDPISVPPQDEPKRPRWPSDYYAEPPATAPGTRPSGLVFGCALLSFTAMVLIAGGGWWLGSGGITKVMKFVFSSTEKQVDLIATGVPDDARKALKEELRRMGSDVDAGRVAFKDVQTVQQSISKAIRDSKLTPQETTELTKALRNTPRSTTR